jgi:hypothetical protein
MYKLYKSQYNPDNLTGQVGGNIGSATLSGYLGELFYTVSAPPSGVGTGVYQYRKVFIKNDYSTLSTFTRIWIDSAEHLEQITIAPSVSLSDTTSSPTISPVGVSGWISPTSFSQGLILGNIFPNGYTGFWIRQELSNIQSPDPYATFRLYAGGIVS